MTTSVKDISLWHRVLGATVGFDVFIAYKQSDGAKYAKALHDELERRGLVVFLDGADEVAGARVAVFASFASRARTLIVLVSPDVFQSSYVREEIEAYAARALNRWWRRPFSRIVPINIDGCLSKAPQAEPWQTVAACVHLPDTKLALAAAEPSRDTIDRIVGTNRFLRATQIFWSGFVAVTLGLLALQALTLRGVISATRLKERAELERQEAMVERDAVRVDIRALQTDKQKIEKKNVDLTSQADALAAREKQLGGAVKELEQKASDLSSSNAALTLAGRVARIRSKALSIVATDPVRAYRLAQYAEQLQPSDANRELQRSALSAVDLAYFREFGGCKLEDAAGDYAVLRCGPSRGPHHLKIIRPAGSEVAWKGASGSRAAIVPYQTSFRLLTTEGTADGAIYRLQDANGNTIGVPLIGRHTREVRCQGASVSHAAIPVAGSSHVLWNLQSDERRVVKYVGADFDFAHALACHGDGKRALSFINDLKLIGPDGTVNAETKTPAHFDYLWTDTSWSPPGDHLSVHIPEGALDGPRGRLGIWSPLKKTFAWLDPDGWLATAYGWADSGRFLAFAGRTEHKADATVQWLDVQSMDAPHTVFQGTSPIRDMAVMSDEKSLAILDTNGQLSVVPIGGPAPTRRGVHSGAVHLRRFKDHLITSTATDVRVWGLDAQRHRLIFRGGDDRRFSRCAAATPRGDQIAAVVSRPAHAAGVAVRSAATGGEQLLAAPHRSCMRLGFTDDGKYLILVAADVVFVWDTASWTGTRIDLQQGDRQFFGFHGGDVGVGLHVLRGLGEQKYIYDVALVKGAAAQVAKRRLVKEFPADACEDPQTNATAGWSDYLERSNYQSQGRFSCPGSNWEVRTWCRDVPLIAADCDHEFVPRDLLLADKLWAASLWKPTSADALE